MPTPVAVSSPAAMPPEEVRVSRIRHLAAPKNLLVFVICLVALVLPWRTRQWLAEAIGWVLQAIYWFPHALLRFLVRHLKPGSPRRSPPGAT